MSENKASLSGSIQLWKSGSNSVYFQISIHDEKQRNLNGSFRLSVNKTRKTLRLFRSNHTKGVTTKLRLHGKRFASTLPKIRMLELGFNDALPIGAYERDMWMEGGNIFVNIDGMLAGHTPAVCSRLYIKKQKPSDTSICLPDIEMPDVDFEPTTEETPDIPPAPSKEDLEVAINVVNDISERLQDALLFVTPDNKLQARVVTIIGGRA